MCNNTFTCYDQINIVGTEIDGFGWFLLMALITFALQIAANFLWLKSAQISREILQLDSKDNKRRSLVGWSVMWTAISTFVWVARIVLVIGNNIWIFITILLGNVTGTYWASTIQQKDRHTLITEIETLLESEEHKTAVDNVLEKLYRRMQSSPLVNKTIKQLNL